MKRTFLITLLAIVSVVIVPVYSQVGISNDSSLPDSSAMLDVKSTNSGFLPPRMTQAQRDAISGPAAGLLVFQTDGIAGYYYYSGMNWVGLTGSGAGGNSPAMCIDYDGNAYPTITIGTQTWMAENLRVTHYRNGDTIPNVTGNTEWQALTTGAQCWYANNQTANAKYGALYNWYTIDDPRGLCPDGWHVPTDAEWTTLTTQLGGTPVAGGKLKGTSPMWIFPNADATNSSGFSGLPGGVRYNDGSWQNLTSNGFWWTSTDTPSNTAWCRFLFYNDATVYVNDNDWKFGMSVRCVRD